MSENSQADFVMIAAGGTGGHIYPALAVAEQLRRLSPSTEIVFVGTPHGLENKIIPKAGFPLAHVPIGRLNRNVSLGERLSTLLRMPWAMAKSFYLVVKFRPRFLLGVGGHASGPLLLMAALLGYRTYIWEANAYPGLANRWLAGVVTEVLVVFDQVKNLLKAKRVRRVGMPVRKEIENLQATRTNDGDFHVLVFGGSQGSRGLNEVVSQMLASDPAWRRGIRFVHQTGPNDFSRVSALYREKSVDIEVTEYLHDMDRRYAWADLLIVRGGISTVAELAAVGRAAIIVPLPTAADNHQQKNAEALVQAHAGEMILQRDLTPEFLKSRILSLKEDKALREQMARNVRKFHEPEAARAIAYHLLEDSRKVE